MGTLPKDMIAVSWHYDAEPDFTRRIWNRSLKAGLETWVAPGVNNWSRVYPNNNEALGNIRAFVRDGQKLGATGMLNTVWNDDGEGIFDENWFGVLFGAAAAWQPGESSEADFHRVVRAGISRRPDRQDQPGAAGVDGGARDAQEGRPRRCAGFASSGSIRFRRKGSRSRRSSMPVAAELRLHAEKAITLLAQARAAAKLDNPEALDAIELGARRIDFIGYKFQAADDCAALYAKAQAAGWATRAAGTKSRRALLRSARTTGALRTFATATRSSASSSMTRGCATIAYWLANNMARYDRAARTLDRPRQCVE